MNTCYLELEGHSVGFSTEDYRSKRFFFPRFEAGRVHEEPVVRLLLQQLQSARCFADVGACLGYYSCFASKALGTGTVYAFEMDRQNYAILEENLHRNGCANVRAAHLAVSDTDGTVLYSTLARFTEFTLAGGGRRIVDKDTAAVQAVTLDGFFLEAGVHPDLIKIDVEGAELKVLKGMSGLARRYGPRVIVEIHRPKLARFHTSPEDVLQALRDLGYRVWQVVNPRGAGEPLLTAINGNSAISRDRVSVVFAQMENDLSLVS